MEKIGSGTRKSDSGFVSNISYYEAKNCKGCSLKCLCHNAKENRRIEVNHNLNRHKEKVRQLLTSVLLRTAKTSCVNKKKTVSLLRQPLFSVGVEGFEPPTLCL